MAKRVLGLDIGSFSIKAVEVHQTSRGLEIGACHELSLSRILASASSAGEPITSEADVAIGRALHDFLSSHGFATDFVVSALPSDSVSSRRLQFPFKDNRKLTQAVPFELEDGIPFDLEDVVVDWQRTRTDEKGSQVLCAFTQRTRIAQTLERLAHAMLRPQILEAEGIALANLYGMFPLPGSRIVVDLGHRKTTLCWMQDGTPLAMRTIPIGGKGLTETIAQEAGISFEAAEDLKHEKGIFTGVDLQSRYPSALALVERLSREILLFRAALEEKEADLSKEVEAIDLLGGGAHLHHIDKFISQRTGILAAHLDVADASASGGLLAAARPLAYGPALALALRGTPRAQTHINFMQDEFAPQIDFRRMARRFAPTLRLAAAAAVLALIWAFTEIGADLYRANQLEQALGERVAHVFANGEAPSGDPIAAMTLAVRDAQKRADFLGVYRGNLSALDLLTELSRGFPADVPASIETLQINRNAITLRGLSQSFESVDRIRTSLEANEYFQSVDVSEIQNDPKGAGKRFHLTIHLSEEP